MQTIYVIQSLDSIMHDVYFTDEEKAKAYLAKHSERWKNIRELKVKTIYHSDED
jgi:hypothetical protein